MKLGKYQQGNLMIAIFRHNIYIINVLKYDKNYLINLYTNLKAERFS